MWDFIDECLYYYELFEFVGWHEEALFELGVVLHPVMDSTAPAHEGFQIWSGKKRDLLRKHWTDAYIRQGRFRKTITRMNTVIDLVGL